MKTEMNESLEQEIPADPVECLELVKTEVVVKRRIERKRKKGY